MVSHNRLMLPTSSLCLEQCRIYAKTPTSTTYGRICRFRCPFPRDSGQHSSKPIDKVALPLQQHGYCRSGNVVFPIYDPSTPVSVAWGHLISSINTAKMERADLEDMPLMCRDQSHRPQQSNCFTCSPSLETSLVPKLGPSTAIP